jgi:NADPH-dependent 2,4-dienoyl-CoA reductase/sulfur reductase-like enzyme
MKIVIIGGVAGGASTAARLRRLDENAEIISKRRRLKFMWRMLITSFLPATSISM